MGLSRNCLVYAWLASTLVACTDDGEERTQGKALVGDSYQSECLDTQISGWTDENVEIIASGDTIRIADHHAEFNCCLDAWMEVMIDGSSIDVLEIEDPDKADACWCICPFELSIEISELDSGLYTVRVFREVMDADHLLIEQEVSIPTPEPQCIEYGDCPAGRVCRDGQCVEGDCLAHSDCGGADSGNWCVLGVCTPGETPCHAAGGMCTVESGCPVQAHPASEPATIHCAFGGHCCLEQGCPDLFDCPAGTICQNDGRCTPVADRCACHNPECVGLDLGACLTVEGCQIVEDPSGSGFEICAMDLQVNCERTGGQWRYGVVCQCPEGWHNFGLGTCVPNDCPQGCSDLQLIDAQMAQAAAERIRQGLLNLGEDMLQEWLQDRVVGPVLFVQRREEQSQHPDVPGWFVRDEYVLVPLIGYGPNDTRIVLSAQDGRFEEIDQIALPPAVCPEAARAEAARVSGRPESDFTDVMAVYVDVGPGDEFGNFNGMWTPLWRFVLDGEEWFVTSRLTPRHPEPLVFRTMAFIPVE